MRKMPEHHHRTRRKHHLLQQRSCLTRLDEIVVTSTNRGIWGSWGVVRHTAGIGTNLPRVPVFHILKRVCVSYCLDLKGLGELITASEWKRAALVWAFTYDAREKVNPTSGKCTVGELAAQRLSGLSKNTISNYRKAWAKAMDDGIACDVKPGDNIQLPDVEWWTVQGLGVVGKGIELIVLNCSPLPPFV